jgi:hypothetical protein
LAFAPKRIDESSVSVEFIYIITISLARFKNKYFPSGTDVKASNVDQSELFYLIIFCIDMEYFFQSQSGRAADMVWLQMINDDVHAILDPSLHFVLFWAAINHQQKAEYAQKLFSHTSLLLRGDESALRTLNSLLSTAPIIYHRRRAGIKNERQNPMWRKGSSEDIEKPKGPEMRKTSPSRIGEDHEKYSAEASAAVNPRFSTTINIPGKTETRTG